MKTKQCQYCGDYFIPKLALQKYCGHECSYGAALRRERNRMRGKHTLYEEADKALAELKASRPEPVQMKRAASLASTPDVPSMAILRDECLTGGCSATMQATSGGRNLAHG